ncbi:hypothetical protein CC80DRAFT_494252 [Byssothecium circinans]|uniref:DH domain-containing protein n=1 Tax=Byssothecium circinans TaxID=147558 RepID=A0A6A5TMB7_9PLEO|nr:hypothetical protein CC80DRAFT_494252 [Byssothecium circinans]
MAESVQNFAYHPSVASWVQSTALAQLDGASDEVAERSPDDFYKSTPTHSHTTDPSADMATTRQRQQTPNGAARSTAKPSVRSVSGSVTSTASTPRSTPQMPVNRPTVRSLAQKFNQPSSAESSPLSTRSRPARTEAPSYGGYKFNHLKARERPQPAPPSPSTTRRSNGIRSSLGPQTTPSSSKKKLTSPPRAAGRQPFFGEVVGEHNASTPGFGILNIEEVPSRDSNSASAPPVEQSTIKLVTDDAQSLPDVSPSNPRPLLANHQRSASDMVVQNAGATQPSSARRPSPPSRIPVLSRRMSASSNSSSSTKSSRFNGSRPVQYSRRSPTRLARVPVGRTAGATSKSSSSSQPTLPVGSYRGYRERGKPQDASSGPSVSAVITAVPPPTSPRLRNSRERQLVQESPGAASRPADPEFVPDYFGDALSNEKAEKIEKPPTTPYQSQTSDTAPVDSKLSVKLIDASPERSHATAPKSPKPELMVNGQDLDAQPGQPPSLTLATDPLQVSPAERSLSTATSFEYEESPVLGMPGSFLMTPPLMQNTPPTKLTQFEAQASQSQSSSPRPSPQAELLQARTFQPANQKRISRIISASDLQEYPSELGSRESIPIMLGTDGPANEPWDATPKRTQHAPRLSIGSQKWRAEHLDDTGTISYLEEDDSPIDPFSHRETLRPEDSASMVGRYRLPDQPNWSRGQSKAPNAGSFTLDSEAWRVVESVLDMYHTADIITPDMAQNSREQVQSVSPVIAQYQDWGSKEATEVYLARLLSDAVLSDSAVSGGRRPSAEDVVPAQNSQTPKKTVPGMSIRALDADPEEPVVGGTAIIFPTESKRYSRGSRNSAGSVATTIWEGQSRADSSSGMSSRERGLGLSMHFQPQEAATPPRPPHSPPPPPNPNVDQALSNIDTRFIDEALQQYKGLTSEESSAAKKQPGDTEGQDSPTDAESMAQPKPEIDEATRMAQKRYRVIEELTKTEHTFCVDMMVAHQIFMNTAKEVLTEEEIRLLFGNCKDVEAFSHHLWKDLKNAIRPIVNQTPPSEHSEEPYDEFLCCTPENDRRVKIGEIMLKATVKMERVYTTYYLNYSDASDFIKKNSNNAALLGWVSACFNHCPSLTTAWDLDSLLVKPVQRMLKYPILLDDLIAKTDPEHPDLYYLKEASVTIKQVASRIEEAKSRQQTLRAATSEGKKAEKKKRFGNTIVKALKKSDKTKYLQDAAALVEDKEYDLITQKFGGHFFQIQIVIHDYQQHMDSVSNQMLHLSSLMLGFMGVSEAAPSVHPEMESTWLRWGQGYLDLQNKVMEEHKRNVRDRVVKPITTVWDRWQEPQKLMEQRKKLLPMYAKYKQALERKDKIDPKLEENAKHFMTINDSLKLELPKLYELTKKCIRMTEVLFLNLQRDFYKVSSRKMLELMDYEPQHTTNFAWDIKSYVTRFTSDYAYVEERAKNMAILDQGLLKKVSTFTTPTTTLYSDDNSSRKSSSRRTESVSSDYSAIEPRARSGELFNQAAVEARMEQRNRSSSGYNSARSSHIRPIDGPPRPMLVYPAVPSFPGPITPRSERVLSPSATNTRDLIPASLRRPSSSRQPSYPRVMSTAFDDDRNNNNTTSGGHQSSNRPAKNRYEFDMSDDACDEDDRSNTTTKGRPSSGRQQQSSYSMGMDGAFDDDREYTVPPAVGAGFLNPKFPNSFVSPTSTSASTPGSSRTSGVFNSALPMSDTPTELPATPSDPDADVEVLFLAASLFEFNIAHDRREGGIPYLVYVPGEIFDVIGMKGELWLARNQDDPKKTVGWIWEKHFARILPEEQ